MARAGNGTHPALMPVLDGDAGPSNAPRGATDSPSPSEPVPPPLLGFYRDLYDDAGNAVGWETIAWGLHMPDGPAVTVSVERPPRVSVWLNPDDAATALDAQVDTVAPRHVAQFGREREA